MTLRIGVDIDDVIADMLGALLDRYNIAYQDTKTPADIKSWDLAEWLKPECDFRVWMMYEPSLYERIQPIPGAFQACEQLRRLGSIFFVSTCRDRDIAQAKLDWLVRHGFLATNESRRFIPVMDGDKSTAPVDMLLDDYPKNVEDFPGWGILVNRPHNADHVTKRLRVNHLGEALSYIRGIVRPCECAKV